MPPILSPPTSPDPVDAAPVQPDAPYSQRFSDQLMKAVLNPTSPTGTVVLDKASNASTNSDAIRIEDAKLPSVHHFEIPLPLEDPRRTYRSAVPGVRLTHPSGLVEGGTALSSSSDTSASNKALPADVKEYAQQLIQTNTVKSPAQLKKLIASETQRQLEILRKQMQDRSSAIAENERLGKEIRLKVDQRAMERKIAERLRREAAERRDS